MLVSVSQRVLRRLSKQPKRVSIPQASSRLCQSYTRQLSTKPSPSKPAKSQLKPWAFAENPTFPESSTQIDRCRLEAVSHARAKWRLVAMLRLVREMKKEGVKPDLIIYNSLLSCLAEECLLLEAWAVVDDMAAMGVALDRQSYNHLLHASRRSSTETMWAIVGQMRKAGFEPDEHIYSHFITHATMVESIELALQYMHEMESHGLVPELVAVQNVVRVAADMDLPKIAIEIAQKFESRSNRKLGGEPWIACLVSSAQMLYADGVETAWQIVVHDLNLTPDEGTCLSVLNTCARHGLADIASDAFRVLRGMGVDPWSEHHFAPLVEALCKKGRLKEALQTLVSMRKLCVNPTYETVQPFAEYLQGDADRIDGAWPLLDQWRSEGNVIDSMVLNTIVQGAVLLGDLHRAVGAYKSFSDYNCKPTIETFNYLLSGCATVKHRELSNKLLWDMKRAAMKPNAKTYEHIILLCLTQSVYEDAFFYLEEMKAQKFIPPTIVYETVIRTCLEARDSRYSMALKEMQQCGYTPSMRLRRLLPDTKPTPSEKESDVEKGDEEDSELV